MYPSRRILTALCMGGMLLCSLASPLGRKKRRRLSVPPWIWQRPRLRRAPDGCTPPGGNLRHRLDRLAARQRGAGLLHDARTRTVLRRHGPREEPAQHVHVRDGLRAAGVRAMGRLRIQPGVRRSLGHYRRRRQERRRHRQAQAQLSRLGSGPGLLQVVRRSHAGRWPQQLRQDRHQRRYDGSGPDGRAGARCSPCSR